MFGECRFLGVFLFDRFLVFSEPSSELPFGLPDVEESLQSGHTISWESSVILRTSPGWRARRLLEAWEINTCKSPLNRDDGMYLPQEYRALALLDKN